MPSLKKVEEERLLSLSDVYRDVALKYRCFLTIESEKLANIFDIGKLMIILDDYVFSEMLCFPKGANHIVYIPNDVSGIWENQEGSRHVLNQAIKDVRCRIHTMIIVRCKKAVKDIRYEMKQTGNDVKKEALKKQLDDVERHLDILKKLYIMLGTPSFVTPLVTSIIEDRITMTLATGFTEDIFNQKVDCLGFTDGIFDFQSRLFVKGEVAKKYYLSFHVDYAFEDVVTVDQEVYECCKAFVKKIFAKKHVYDYVLRIIADSLRRTNLKKCFIHYNITGSNGKTTFFLLVKAAIGSLFMRCSNGLIYTSTSVAPNQSNEELMSIKNRCIILFSEPNARQHLNIAFLKDLTGGDEQTARRNYGSKETFRFQGSPHILCNRIPQLEDVDGGVEVRIRCIPYESQFVDDDAQVDEAKFIYKGEPDVQSNFSKWRFAFMKMVLESSMMDVCEPPEVVEHTKKLIYRDNIVKRFVDECITKTDNRKDIMLFSHVFSQFNIYCRENKTNLIPKDHFSDDIEKYLGAMTVKSGSIRNFWRGFTLEYDCTIMEDDLDD